MKSRVPTMTAAELRDAMKKHGVTMHDLSTASGMGYRSIRAYYYGERPVPPSVVIALSAATIAASSRTAVAEARSEERSALRQRIAALEVSLRYARRNARRGAPGTELAVYQDAVDAMCRSCEPETEMCRQSDCSLRPVSPYPLVIRRKVA